MQQQYDTGQSNTTGCQSICELFGNGTGEDQDA